MRTPTKRLAYLLLAPLFIHAAQAASTVPFYEAFPTNYGNGTLLGAGATATAWDIGNTGTSGGSVVTNVAALSYSGLVTSNSYGLLISGTPGSTRNKGATFTSQTLGANNPSVYASFLLDVLAAPAPTANRLFAGLCTNSSGTSGSGVMGVWVNSSTNLLISKNSSSTPATTNTAPLSPGTHLVVLRYKWNAAAGDDEVALWVDPGALGVGEGSVPNPTITATNGSDVSFIQSVWIFHPTTASLATTLRIDEFRVGTNWAQVTPADGPAAPPSAPYVTQTLLTANGLVLRGTNGPANGVYQVLAVTNVAQLLYQWPSIATNAFDAGGNFDCTNPVSPAATQQFYRLLVGDELPPAPVAPTITNPPASLTVTAGQSAGFNVGASGTGPLSYQWYFNTNTVLTNATSASLTLPNVSTNDAGGYSVRVANSVGAVTSIVATLTVLVPPAIITEPTNQTVNASQIAVFTVLADGTAPLRYQWYFNPNTPLANATNATLTLTNVQSTNGGGYSVRVTNSVGSITSVVATLTVLAPPAITTQPQNQSVTVGNDATFTVTATGPAPLCYQWYFNTNTVLASGTNAALTITNAQNNDAGGYSVIVTNAYGATTSLVATLTVNAPATNTPDFSLVGFATLDGFNTFGYNQRVVGGTTGGAGGAHVQVWTAQDLANHLQSNATLIVEIMTNIDLGIPSLAAGIAQPTYSNFLAAEILVRSNKTIYSTNGATLSHGTLRMGKPSLGPQGNIIIRNLKFRDLWEYDPSGNYDSKGWDYVHLEEGSHHVWVDHCDFDKVYDGIIDAVHGSDYLTVSWNVFRNQKKCSLIGHSDSNQSEDTNHLNVTFHHNYYVDVDERMPRMRFGNAHVFNLYCENLGGNGIQSTAGAATLVENVYFYHPTAGSLPTREENGGPTGTVKVVNSTIVNSPGNNVAFRQYGAANFTFNFPFATNQPPYPYTNVMHPVSIVPYIVTNYAGVGKIGF